MANRYGDYGKVTWGSKTTREGDVWYVVDTPDLHMLYTTEEEAKRIAQEINYSNPTSGKDWGGRPAPESYADEMQYQLDDYWNGSPQEQQAYNEDGYLSAINEISGAVNVSAPFSEFLPPAKGLQEPGATALAARRDAELRNQQTGYRDAYVARNDGYVSGLEDTYSSLNSSDQALFGEYRGALSNINLDPVSLASSNPADVARQEQAYGMLMGAANGSMDASSNPADVARQQQVFGMLMGAAGGSLDAYTNPEDLARQQQAAHKLWGLTDTEMTAEEQFIMEKARRQEEQSRQSQLQAAIRDLASRGQLGSGHEIGANMDAQQITSENRMLQDLGALANASQRSMAALGQFSNLSTNMRNASDAMTSGNMNRRMGGMQGGGAVAGDMRNASDAMATGNMNRRASSAASAGAVAGDMRNASDAIASFNAGQQNTWNYQNAGLRMDQAQGIANTGMQVNQNVSARASNLASTQLGASQQGYNADSDLTSLGIDLNTAAENRERLKQQDYLQLLRDRWAADMQEDAVDGL